MRPLVRVVSCCSILVACTDAPSEPPPDVMPDPTCDVRHGAYRDQRLVAGDGQEDRYYWLYIPTSYRCDDAPLLVDFHGTASGRAEEAYGTEGVIALAEAHGVIVARPRSRSKLWNGYALYQWDINPGDLERNELFAKLLVAELTDLYEIDETRIYASGFSSGSNMVAQFAADASSPFAGIAPIAGGPWQALPLGTQDDGPRVYLATAYRDYLWPYARQFALDIADAGLPGERLLVRRSGGGHELYAWHFAELFAFLDRGERPERTAIVAPWTEATLPSPADVLALALDGTELVAAGAQGRTWRRDANGWRIELDRGGTDYTALCFGPNGRAFVGGMHTAALRGDAGWSQHRGVPDYGQLGAGWVNGATCRADGSIVVGGYWSSAVTTNGGQTWSRFAAPTTFGVDYQVAALAEVPGGATLLAGNQYLGVAAPGAAQAEPAAQPPHAGWWNAITVAPGNTAWAVGDDGALARSDDGGATWSQVDSGTDENLYAVHFGDAAHGAAVGRRGTVLVTSDGGATWTARPLGRDVFLGAAFVDATTITVAGEDGLIATSAR